MPDLSRWSVPIPRTSLPSYLFTSPYAPISRAPLYIDAERPDTYYLSLHDYREWSKRLAAGLIAAGLEPGDRVMLCSGNAICFPVVLMGTIMAGGIYTSGNPTYTSRELGYQLKNSGARFLLVTESVLDMAEQAAVLARLRKDRIFVFDDEVLGAKCEDKKGFLHWKALIAGPEVGTRFKWKECSSVKETNGTIVLNYSSGTTGLPKGVESTHYNYIANCVQVNHQLSLDPLFSTQEDVAQRSRWLCTIPLCHGFAQIQFGIVAAKRVVPVYIMKTPNFGQLLKNIERFRISELTLVPPIMVAMAKHLDARHGRKELKSVLRIFCGAAPLGKDIQERVEKLWSTGQVNVKQGWGMTEATCMVLGWDPRLISTSSSVGELLANCEAKLMDDDGACEVPRGQRGEFWCRAPNVMKGYWKNLEATRETITEDGWLKTGDVAHVDSDGMYHIVDRKKELIKVKGVQVAPAELESLLLDHPRVQDAAVIGIARNGDEYPRAYVVVRPGDPISENEILEHVNSQCSKHKRITGGIIFVATIPKTPAGKILRKLLRERAETEIKREVNAKL